MKRLVFALIASGAAFSVAAEEPKLDFGGPLFGQFLPGTDAQEGADFQVGVFSFGLWQNDSDTISSKFLEYRDIPQGAVAPFFRLSGKKGNYRYDLIGHDVTQKDQRYSGKLEASQWKVEVDYTGIPHNFGNGGKSILEPVGETEWRLSDTLQGAHQDAVTALPSSSRTYPNLAAIVNPTLVDRPADLDIKLQRNRSNIAFSLFPTGQNFDIGVTYFHERRSGSRTNNGTSFGFNNVVETPEPVRFITQDFGITATSRREWGVIFGALHLNDFSDRFDTFSWDNPFRVTDSTDPSAYQSPGSNSVNGPKTGLAALPPSNQAWNVSGGTALKLGSKSRLSADLQFGQWTQNEQAFIPFTTNTAIVTPSGANAATAPLPATSLDGKIDVFAFNSFYNTRLTDDLQLNARFRLYSNENQTPRIRFEEGYVRFDAAWEEIPRITVPYGFDSSYFDVYATYDVGRLLGLEVGYKFNRIDRTFRESEHTSENTIRAAADLKLDSGVLVRGLYERGNRDYDDYDGIHGEEASFLEPDAPANLTVLRRYDQANRDRDRVGAQVQWTPENAMFTLSAAYYLNRDTYDDSPVPCDAATSADLAFCPGGEQASLGLQEAEYKTFSLDADFSPSDRTTLYGFYSREDVFSFQAGRQSGSTINFDPASNWTSEVDDKVDTIGAGLNFTLVPAKWFLDLFYRFQNVDGNNDFEAGPNLRGPTNPAVDIPEYDDTKIHFFSSQVRYHFAPDWSFGLGAFLEEYTLKDTQTGQVLYYMPSSFFINAVNGDYNAWVGWLNLSYSF
jgi:MtrB/PioB family decaheme-associated outer membrane protein